MGYYCKQAFFLVSWRTLDEKTDTTVMSEARKQEVSLA